MGRKRPTTDDIALALNLYYATAAHYLRAIRRIGRIADGMESFGIKFDRNRFMAICRWGAPPSVE